MQRGLTTNNELLEEIDIVKNHLLKTMLVNQRAVKKIRVIFSIPIPN